MLHGIALLVLLWPLSSWDQFRHNVGNNAVVRGTLTASWRIRTGGSYSSSPAIANGVLYVNNNNGSLYAIEPQSGHVFWTYHATSSLMTNPLVMRGTVIVGEGNQISYVASDRRTLIGTSENAVIAVDASNGRERWRVPLAGTGMPTPALVGAMLVEHDGNGDVTGIDVNTGHVMYRAHIGGAASMVSMLPVGHDRFVTQSVTPNSVWELDGRSGAVLWQHHFEDLISGLSDCPPASDGKRVFCDYTVPPPGADRAHVGFLANQHMFALDVRTGSLLWDFAYASGTLPEWNEAAIPLVYNKTLYVGSSVASQIDALNPASGRILWQRTVNGPVKGGMCGKDGVVYAGDGNGYLWAINARSGAVIGVKNMHTVFNVGSPLIAGETLIVGTNTGEIMAVPLGEIRNARDS